MESDDPRVLGPMLFLLLLMLYPLLSAESFQPSVLGWKKLNHHLGQEWEGFNQKARYHRSEKDRFRFCDGKFDLYFLLDTSDNLKDNWDEVYKFVDQMVKKYRNPELRMSFITSEGKIIMELTSDRKEIQEGLTRLQNVVPSGEINMEHGFRKANEKIQPVYKKDKQAGSLIISVVGGMMPEDTLLGIRKETNKARNMRAKVYSVGLDDYSRRQLTHIVEGDHQIYERENYQSTDDLVQSLVDNSCLDVMGEDIYFVCVGESYNLGFFSSVLNKQNMDQYYCKYKLDKTTVYTLKAINMTKHKLICQGHIFEKDAQEVVVDYSLDNGVTFKDRSLKMTSRNCQNTSTVPTFTRPPALSTTLRPTTTTTTTTRTTTATTQRPTSPPPLQLILIIPAIFIFPLLFCCIWPLRTKKTVKEPPAVHKPEEEPQSCHMQTCPRVIVPCCGCQQGNIQRMEDKLDMCDFVQNCSQVPLMYCQSRNKGRCIDVTLANPHCTQILCGPKSYLQPSQDYFPFNSCCSWHYHHPQICSQLPSRMLPLIPPTAHAPCSTTLSLPPP